MARRVLITGAAGFIGRHLVSALAAQDLSVRALVRNADDAAAMRALGAEPCIGDLLEPDTARRAVDGVHAVYHLAGRLYAAGSRAADYSRLHVDATRTLVEASAAASVETFLHCSTTGVHGPTGAAPAKEDDPGHPLNPYEQSKAEGEAVVRHVASTRRLSVAIARPGLVYGPGDLHLLGWFRSIQSGFYRVVGDGTNHLHPIYIDDTVRGLLACAAQASPEARAYHLVGASSLSMRELSDAIGSALNRPVPRQPIPAPLAFAAGAMLELLPVPRRALPLTRSRVTFMLQHRSYDGSRARESLGFAPTVGLRDGLAKTVAWYRENGLL
jgi:nucleoside-diphosphate-sugar epimerase